MVVQNEKIKASSEGLFWYEEGMVWHRWISEIKIDICEGDNMSKAGTGNIIEDNKNATNQSFLYFMHEENIFDEKSFSELYNYINKLDSVSLAEL